MKIYLSKLLEYLLFLFLFIISIDPAGIIFHIKEPLFVILVILAGIISVKTKKKLPKEFLFIILLCLLIPIYGFIISLMTNSLDDIDYAFGHIKSFLFIFIFVCFINIDFDRLFKLLFINGTIIALLSLIIMLIFLVNDKLGDLIYIYFLQSDNVIVSYRTFIGITILGVYFKVGPFIIFSYVYSLYFLSKNNHWRPLLILVNFIPLLFSGSRTPALVILFITLVYLCDKIGKNVLIKVVLFIVLGGGLLYLVYLLVEEKDESSNVIKYAMSNSYISNIFLGSNSIVGSGLGSIFYAAGRDQYISASELTYFDIIRIYGIPLGSILIFIVFYPFVVFTREKYYIDKRYRPIIMSYVLYMILAGTNPLLISSTGMFVFAFGLALIYKIENDFSLIDCRK